MMPIKKLYLAAMFSRREEMEGIANKLKDHGFEVTARWVYGGETGLTLEDIAKLDLEDVRAADAIISFTHPRGTMTTGGGRHVEFGYGLALEKKMFLIGSHENVFHHYPGVRLYESIDSWIRANKPKE